MKVPDSQPALHLSLSFSHGRIRAEVKFMAVHINAQARILQALNENVLMFRYS